MPELINLYSDTQTRPTPAMRDAIAQAEVGDEQRFEDPSVNQLCALVAELTGKEKAVFLPSGTMCNEIAILVHCRPGDEIYADESAHITHFEAGGPAALAGTVTHSIPGHRGLYTADQLEAAIRVPNRYSPTPRLVEVEQTANLGGGSVWPLAQIRDVADVARSRGLALHLDGARLPNAVVASGHSFAEFSQPFDTVWIDLTKGLGCPCGAVLAGSRAFIDEAWKWKQRLGGALRQGGVLAAAGLYAFGHNIDRLADDHANARRFAQAAGAVPGARVDLDGVESNMVFIDISESGADPATVSARLEEQGVRIGALGHRLRAVTHLDVTTTDVDTAAEVFASVMADLPG
ncbi:MAG: aminotransferase class I/II-fold pyridoxal phosphate-dependent enzyme [Actinomycetia bacterium]|nr:aminotransferase class I/II-fold pyridoxal phosphate-dependent enzyme [Actinomycetes bacterium]